MSAEVSSSKSFVTVVGGEFIFYLIIFPDIAGYQFLHGAILTVIH